MKSSTLIGVGIALLVIIALIILIPVLIINSVQRSTAEMLEPITSANEALKTQVSDLLNPTPTIVPDPITIINEVRALARLETIQYTVEKVITAEVNQDTFSFLFGDRILFVAHGEVIAGIDLSKLQDDDIQIDNETLRIRLPEPEVFIATLDNQKSYVYNRETGILRNEIVDLETQARQAAEQEILKAALEDGILEQAKVNGEVYLERLFDALGYDEMIFEYQPQPTPVQ